MAYVAMTCFTSKVPLENTNRPQVLQNDEKAAIITDFVVAVLISTVGALALIQIAGIANLGCFSCLGAIGPEAAYAMIGVGAAIVAVDIIKLMIQQARHISKLQSLANSRNSQHAAASERPSEYQGNARGRYLTEIEEEAPRQLEAQKNHYESIISGEKGRQRIAVEEATGELSRQIEELKEELKIAREEAEKPLLEEIEQLKSEQAEVVKHAGEEASKELNERIELLQKELENTKEETVRLQDQIENLTREHDAAVRDAVEKKERALSERIHELETAKLEAEAKLKLEEELEEIQKQAEQMKLESEESTAKAKEEIALLEKRKTELEEELRLLEELKAEMIKEKKIETPPPIEVPASEAIKVLEEEQRKAIAETLDFSYHESLYDLRTLDFTNLKSPQPQEIQEALGLTKNEGKGKASIKETITYLQGRKETLISEAARYDSELDLTLDQSKAIEVLQQMAEELKGHLSTIQEKCGSVELENILSLKH